MLRGRVTVWVGLLRLIPPCSLKRLVLSHFWGLILGHYFSSQYLVIVETPPNILILAYHGALFVRHPPRLLPGGVIFGNAPEASQSDIGIVSNSSKAAVACARFHVCNWQRRLCTRKRLSSPAGFSFGQWQKAQIEKRQLCQCNSKESTEVEADCLHALQAALRAFSRCYTSARCTTHIASLRTAARADCTAMHILAVAARLLRRSHTLLLTQPHKPLSLFLITTPTLCLDPTPLRLAPHKRVVTNSDSHATRTQAGCAHSFRGNSLRHQPAHHLVELHHVPHADVQSPPGNMNRPQG